MESKILFVTSNLCWMLNCIGGGKYAGNTSRLPYWWYCRHCRIQFFSFNYSLFVFQFIFVTSILFNSNVTYNGQYVLYNNVFTILVFHFTLFWNRSYPEWAIMCGWFSCIASIALIPIYILYKLVVTRGTLNKVFPSAIHSVVYIHWSLYSKYHGHHHYHIDKFKI